MMSAVLTQFQQDILNTAVLMIQPFGISWLARALRRAERGVRNQAGILCRKGILSPAGTDGYYCFADPADANKRELALTETEKTKIYASLWRALSTRTRSDGDSVFLKLWAAVKTGCPEAENLVLEGLSAAFRQVDDTLAKHISDLCRDWCPDSVYVKMAEWDFLKGNLTNAIEKLEKLPNTSPAGDQARVLLTRIRACSDPAYPAVRKLRELLDEGLDRRILNGFTADVIIRYQELGLSPEAQHLLDTSRGEISGDDSFLAENYWLAGRQHLLNGDPEKALQTFQEALNTLERSVDRALGAAIMMDTAKAHGIRGNPVRENHCLQIAEHLLHRGTRYQLRETLMLYRLDRALEYGDFQTATQTIYRLVRDGSHPAGHRVLSVAAYAGLIIARRLNRPFQCAAYMDYLCLNLRYIPKELHLRCWYVLGDVSEWEQDKTAAARETLMQYITGGISPGNGDQTLLPERFRPDAKKAEYFRLGQLAGDWIIETARKPLHNDTIRRALEIAERIGDRPRMSRYAMLFKPFEQADAVEDDQTALRCDSFVKHLLTIGSPEPFETCVHEFFQDVFGIQSGVYLIRKQDIWRWCDSWGHKPGLKEKRAFIRAAEKNRAAKHQGFIESGSWIGICFPPLSPERGFLLLKPNPAAGIPADAHRKYLAFVIHPITLIRNALKNRTDPSRIQLLPVSGDYSDRIIGHSPQIHHLRNMIRVVCDTPTTVHITGETGTGKELIARAIHYCGNRKNNPFIAFNCSTGSESLIESELFGHRRGAFTGAVESRKGIFLTADRGTVFLDEVADLPPVVQAKLLRVIQERTIRPLGSDQDHAVTVRILSASNRNLAEEVKKGRFRSDLFYRLVVICLHAPPLRERGEDILILADHFLNVSMQAMGRSGICLSPHARKWLQRRYWNGNVRELQNLMEAAVNFTPSRSVVDAGDLSAWASSAGELSPETLAEATQRYQYDHIRKMLENCNGEIGRTAERLGVSRQTLFKKMKSMDILTGETE